MDTNYNIQYVRHPDNIVLLQTEIIYVCTY